MKVQFTSEESSIVFHDDAGNIIFAYKVKGVFFEADALKIGSALSAVMEHFEGIANGIKPVDPDAQARARAAEFGFAEAL